MIKVNIRTVFISTITVSSFEKTVILTSTSHVMDLDWIGFIQKYTEIILTRFLTLIDFYYCQPHINQHFF